jgi:hypothetical protein
MSDYSLNDASENISNALAELEGVASTLIEAQCIVRDAIGFIGELREQLLLIGGKRAIHLVELCDDWLGRTDIDDE